MYRPKVWRLDRTYYGYLAAVALCALVPSVAVGAGEVKGEEPMWRGAVVEEVGQGTTLERAGLRAGDIVLAWERLPSPPANPEGAQGTIDSVFDWMWLEIEQAPRGTVRLTVQRDGDNKVVEVAPGEWDATLREQMPTGLLTLYLEGDRKIRAGQVEEGIKDWLEMHRLSRNEPAEIKVWINLLIGSYWWNAGQTERGKAAWASALSSSTDTLVEATVWIRVGTTLAESNNLEDALEAFLCARHLLESFYRDSLLWAQIHNELGRLKFLQDNYLSSQEEWYVALEIRRKKAPYSLALAENLSNLGVVAMALNELDLAGYFLEESLDIIRLLNPNGGKNAEILNNLAKLAWMRGHVAEARDRFENVLEILQDLTRDDLKIVKVLNNLGVMARVEGDFEQSLKYYQEALSIQERVDPDSLEAAAILNNIGNISYVKGDFDAAISFFERDLNITEKLAPQSLGVALTLNNIGNVEADRGYLISAEDYYERAISILRAIAPKSQDFAMGLHNIGVLAADRGNNEKAEKYILEALEMYGNVSPGTIDVARCMKNIGILALKSFQFEKAEYYLTKSLKNYVDTAPGSEGVAANLSALGSLAYERGDLHIAKEFYGDAYSIYGQLAPGSLEIADISRNLGLVALAGGELSLARDLFQESHAITQKLNSGGMAEAKSLYDLGTVSERLGFNHRAYTLYRKALETAEKQMKRQGGTRDQQAIFRSHYMGIFRHPIRLALELDLTSEAFSIVEFSRAQSFLGQLAERDLIFSDVPADLEHQRRSIVHAYDQTQAKLAVLHVESPPEELDGLQDRLQQLRWDYEDVTGKIIKASPRLGALRYPKPLDLDGARQVLDPGTVMLSYSVDEEQTHLFVLNRDGKLQVETLPIGEEELGREVRRILGLQERKSKSSHYTKPMRQVGERLYRKLIEPVESLVAPNDRVLIVPDGPLHLLPFALLVRPVPEVGEDGRDFEYLVEWKPIHSALSATVYGELQKLRRHNALDKTETQAFVGFGDPWYASKQKAEELKSGRSVDVYVRSAARRGFDFEPLPYSRQEVDKISKLFPPDSTRVFFSKDATEEQVKSVGKTARILHFATHGRFDSQIPLNSYLALTIPEEFQKGKENGLLQAWEIFESVRIDADLVTLSACESGLGEELATEGLIGLTRAFQFAGARTVMSSLWQVNDQATAELMERFYRHLRAGKSKDEALRAAQIALIQGEAGEDFVLPYHWAAFQLLGDWM